MKTLAERLKYARELRGLSQGDLAKRVKCAQGTIGNIESGTRDSLRLLIPVARALSASADWLYDGKGPMPIAGKDHKNTEPVTTAAIALAAESVANYEKAWPFSVAPARITALCDTHKSLINAYIEGIVQAHEANAKKKSNGP